MSTSVLYDTFSLTDVQLLQTYEEDNAIIIQGRILKRALCCPNCKSRKVICKGKQERRYWLPPIGLRRSFLRIEIPRLKCQRCQSKQMVRPSFLFWKKPHHKVFCSVCFGTTPYWNSQ